MSTTELQAVPVGTWAADKVHSDIAFAIDYMAGTFQGTANAEGTLEPFTLKVSGTGAASVSVARAN